MPQPKGVDRRIKVAACRPMYTGKNPAGHTYTIYEIDACKPEDGAPINAKMRAFQALPVGQVLDVTVVKFESERHGTSYTLHPKEKTTGTTNLVNELAAAVEEQKRMIATLADRVGAMEAQVIRMMRANGQTPGQPNAQELEQRFGAEAPW